MFSFRNNPFRNQTKIVKVKVHVPEDVVEEFYRIYDEAITGGQLQRYRFAKFIMTSIPAASAVSKKIPENFTVEFDFSSVLRPSILLCYEEKLS